MRHRWGLKEVECRYCGKPFVTELSNKRFSLLAKRLCRDCRYVLPRDVQEVWAA